MKKMIAAVAMLVVMAGAASAQGGGGGGRGAPMTPEQMAEMMKTRVDAIFKDVTVTDAIKAKTTEILTKAQMDSRAVARDAADRAEQVAKINKTRNDDILALVTNADDKKKVEANLAALPAGGRRGGGPGSR